MEKTDGLGKPIRRSRNFRENYDSIMITACESPTGLPLQSQIFASVLRKFFININALRFHFDF